MDKVYEVTLESQDECKRVNVKAGDQYDAMAAAESHNRGFYAVAVQEATWLQNT